MNVLPLSPRGELIRDRRKVDKVYVLKLTDYELSALMALVEAAQQYLGKHDEYAKVAQRVIDRIK